MCVCVCVCVYCGYHTNVDNPSNVDTFTVPNPLSDLVKVVTLAL